EPHRREHHCLVHEDGSGGRRENRAATISAEGGRAGYRGDRATHGEVRPAEEHARRFVTGDCAEALSGTPNGGFWRTPASGIGLVVLLALAWEATARFGWIKAEAWPPPSDIARVFFE